MRNLGDVKLTGSSAPSSAAISLSTVPAAIMGHFKPAYEEYLNYWQETNNDGKITASLTAEPTADCLIVAAAMHRDENISIEGEGWTKAVTSPVIPSGSTTQYVTVWSKKVEKGSHIITVNQSSSVRMSLKVFCLYKAKGLTVIDNSLVSAFPITPSEKNRVCQRLYLLSSIFAIDSTVSITADTSRFEDMITMTEQRFSAFYDYERDNLSVPDFITSLSDYDANTANLITLEVEE